MTNYRKHGVRFIEKWDVEDRKGFVVSLPGALTTQHADGETMLGDQIAVTSDEVLKTVTMKAFSKVQTLPSLPRIVLIEDKLETFLSKDAYFQSETIQNNNVKALLDKLDIKDLDVAEFLEAVGKLATKEQIVALQTALDAEKQINLEQKAQIAKLVLEVADRVSAEFNVEGKVVRSNEVNQFAFPIPKDSNIHCARVFIQGLKLPASSYAVSQVNDLNAESNAVRILFVDGAVVEGNELDIEVSLKKK